MDRATVSRIEDWESRPVAGGYAGLHELADAGFTGAVGAGGAHLFMLNGRAVGLVGGTISALDGAEATAYEAPHPALPLLFAMQARGGEVRGKYYTDDTPLEEVDKTLSEGGFTGYLELSENVLSGDYYVAYYGGRSLSAAFIGNEGRVETGDEAFRLAADEVGIYEVRSVDLDVIDIPEPAEPVGTAAGAADADPEPDTDGEEASAEDGDAEGEEDAAEDAHAEGEADDAPADEPEEAADEPEDADPPEADEPAPAAESEAEDEPLVEDAEAGTGAGVTTETAEPARAGGDSPEAAATGAAEPAGGPDGPGTGGSAQGSTATPGGEAGGEEPEERFREEARWRETRPVPALDPDESETPDGGSEPPRVGTGPPGRETVAAEREPPNAAGDDAFRERVEQLEAELASRERERKRLAERVEEVTEERDTIDEEREDLKRRIDRLEAQIEAAADAGSAASSGVETSGAPTGEAMDAASALDRTDLFVRYGSKGEATLQRAHDGQAGREDVADNLRLETHCRFDAEGVTVDGRPFEEFLEDSIEYRFVAWLVEDLLYEIRQTGSERALRQLYDALPKVDRAEFHGVITSRDEEGEEREETFDVVCRNRMGQPLLVANINDSLDPATGDMMASLIEDATAAGESAEPLAAAFLVTASFFEPNALETASEATGGGFLSRDSKKSFVKLSRKGGYHLCLVEARGEDFHLAVPEL